MVTYIAQCAISTQHAIHEEGSGGEMVVMEAVVVMVEAVAMSSKRTSSFP